MTIQNRIIKVQKRNRALVTFDEDRICKAVLRAAETINGFRQDYLPGINDKIFEAYGSDERIAGFIADAVVLCLNSQPHHLIANFPPTIEAIRTTCCTRCAVTGSKTRRMHLNVTAGAGTGCARARSTRCNLSGTASRRSGWRGRWSGTASVVATRWRG